MSAIQLYDFNRLIKHAEIAAAMSLEALLANMKPYDSRLHELRGFSGAVRSAKSIRKCLDGSDLMSGKMKTKVQDAYSMRSSPQVIGAAHDACNYARTQVEIELNGVGDNPIFLPDENVTLPVPISRGLQFQLIWIWQVFHLQWSAYYREKA